jgi:acyl-coenzyme A synthetase/AMP-(fatty) acid ligase
MYDRKEFIVSFLATVRVGCVALLMNPATPPQQLTDTIKKSLCRMIISEEQFAETLLPSFGDRDNETFVFVKSNLGLQKQHSFVSTIFSWEDILAKGRQSVGSGAPVCATVADSPCFWLCTSGTTGAPKVVMHRHIDMRIGADTFGDQVLRMSLDKPDVSFSAAPMFHAYGLGNSINYPLSFGGTVVVEPRRPLVPSRVAELVAAHRPSVFYSVPSGFNALIQAELPTETFSSVRVAVSAGEPLPGAIFDRFSARYSVDILDGIGSSEASNFYCSNRLGAAKRNSCGTPLAGHEVQLRDEDGCSLELSRGCRGEMFVKTPSAATGYYCDAENSRKSFVGAYVATGDMFELIEDGHFKVSISCILLGTFRHVN